MHSIKRFFEFSQDIKIIVVLPGTEVDRWKELVTKYSFPIEHHVVMGGLTRYHSVRNGLEEIKEECMLAIHDGVRPLCTTELIARCFNEAIKFSNSIPAIPVTDTVRDVSSGNVQVNREALRLLQTPQCFNSTLLKKAYANSASEKFTDDAGVFEVDGNIIHLTEGEKTNIKITEPADLILASALEKELFGK